MDSVNNDPDNNQSISNDKSDDYRCGLCDETFSEEASLGNHILTIHKPKNGTSKSSTEENPVPHICDLCEKSYIRKHCLEKHKERIHRNERFDKCNTCGKIFSNIDNLNKTENPV